MGCGSIPASSGSLFVNVGGNAAPPGCAQAVRQSGDASARGRPFPTRCRISGDSRARRIAKAGEEPEAHQAAVPSARCVMEAACAIGKQSCAAQANRARSMGKRRRESRVTSEWSHAAP